MFSLVVFWDCQPWKFYITRRSLLFSILYKLPNHCSLLFCKNSFMFFNFSLVLNFPKEILSSCLMLHIHLTILVSFISSQIKSSSTGQVSLPCSITVYTHLEYNLPVVPKGKPLLANRDTESVNFHHLFLIIVITLSDAHPHVTKITIFSPKFPDTSHLILCFDQPYYIWMLICTCLTFKHAIFFQFISNTAWSLMN